MNKSKDNNRSEDSFCSFPAPFLTSSWAALHESPLRVTLLYLTPRLLWRSLSSDWQMSRHCGLVLYKGVRPLARYISNRRSFDRHRMQKQKLEQCLSSCLTSRCFWIVLCVHDSAQTSGPGSDCFTCSLSEWVRPDANDGKVMTFHFTFWNTTRVLPACYAGHRHTLSQLHAHATAAVPPPLPSAI